MKGGNEVVLNITPSSWLTDLDGRGMSSLIPFQYRSEIGGYFPLGSAPSITTFYCAEDEGFIKYETDRFGFRNVDSLWDVNTHDAVIIGDSFAESACVQVPFQSYFSQSITVVSLGKGGNGPLTSLAVLTEYLKVYKPSIIFHFVVSNDYSRPSGHNLKIDLERELQESELRKYLSDANFHIGYFNKFDLMPLRKFSIDFSRRSILSSNFKRDDFKIRFANLLSYGFLEQQAKALHKLGRAKSSDRIRFIDSANLASIYQGMISQASKHGTTVRFVLLPDKQSTCSFSQKHAFITEIFQSININPLDLWPALCGSQYFSSKGSHFNKQGYKKLAEILAFDYQAIAN